MAGCIVIVIHKGVPVGGSRWYVYLVASTRGVYEAAFVLVPIIVWSIALLSVGTGDQISRLAAWPFSALALYSAALRDGITVFHRDNQKDRRQRDILVVLSLFGVVISSVLLTLAILYSEGGVDYLFSAFYEFVWFIFWFGVALLFVTKTILSLRKDFDHYV